MPSLALDDCLIWFAHCPKAGGTSVEQTMVQQWGDRVGHLHWGWDLWWKRGGWREADPPNSPQHLIWDDALEVLPRAPDAVFALVRDPATRIISEYGFQRHRRRGRLLGRWLARLPFALWLRVMMAVRDQNPHAFDNHLRPQCDFIPECAAVFRLEEGLAAPLAWLAQTTATNAPKTTLHLLKGAAGPPALSTAIQARIAEAFAADYARFGYPIPDVPPPRPDRWDRLAEIIAPVLVWLDRRGRL